MDREEALAFVRQWWPDDAEKVISACDAEQPFDGTQDDFLSHCTACGGNWGGMLLTGIKALWPKVYEAIPDNMGTMAFGCLCNTLVLLGVRGVD